MSTADALESLHVAAVSGELGWDVTRQEPGFLLVHTVDSEYFLLVDPAEPELVRFGISAVWAEATTRTDAADAAAWVNRRCAGVKATLTVDRPVTVFAAEMVVAPAGQLPAVGLVAAVLDRMAGALQQATVLFDQHVVLAALEPDRPVTAG